MDRKLSLSDAGHHREGACIGGLSRADRKNTTSAGAKCKRSPPMPASENSLNHGGNGKNNHVGFRNCVTPVSGKPTPQHWQHPIGGADAGRNRNPEPKHHVPSNSKYNPSPSLPAHHQPRLSIAPYSNREAPVSSLAVGGLHHADTSKSSKVVDGQKTATGPPHCVSTSLPHCGQSSENASVCSFGNIYKRAVNTYACSKEASGGNAVTGLRDNGVPCKEVQVVQKNSHVLGLGGGNYGHGNIIKGGNLLTNGPSANCISYRDVLDICTSKGGATCCKNMEELKNVGNEEYKKGHFLEAISSYDKAIALCPRNAACHNNKAAALAGLGLYEEAVGECLEAISCDQSYSRAHYRLGNLYARLGRVEDAKWHLKLSGECPGSETLQKIQQIETHVINARNARNAEDWNLLLVESSLAIHVGADASNQMLSFKAEALLKLHKADEALELLMVARESQMKKSSKVRKYDACLVVIEMQSYIYLGRFEDAVAAAEYLVQVDSRPESFMWLRKARALTDARKTGNELYKAQKYFEACNAYEQGLQYAPMNSVLLCNQAACRCKLGQWEMAIQDCDAALKSRPEYTKALLRRARANAKLQYWEESLGDYEALNQKMPDDLSISHSLLEVQMKIKHPRHEGDTLQLGGHVTNVNSYTLFLKLIQCAGFALLQFFMKSDDRCKQLSPLVNDLSRRYPSWSFLKVDVEENPDWAKIESIKIVPIFIIYKDGHKLREISKPDQRVLEHALQFHSALVA
uniref:TPR repeat-containing thioredoxin TTL1 n=2 Tax=Anthurium amnicola TaxID=1678845 RepID=A0A1D1YZ86_9ARAE